MVEIRLLRTSDRERVERFVDGLSVDTIRKRFMAGGARVSLAWMDTLDSDGRQVALAAFVGDEVVGVARTYDAEMAVTVADAWQRRGVGRLLVAALACRAAGRGLTELHGWMWSDNAGARALVRTLGPVRVVSREGAVIEVAVRSDAAGPRP